MKHPRTWAVGFMVACLTACTGSLFQSKAAPLRVYKLSAAAHPTAAGTPTPAAPIAASIPVDLAVLKTLTSSGLKTDRIAVLYPDRHLDYFADARWSGLVGEVLQDLAVQAFRAHAGLRTVSGDASAFSSAYWLEIEVTDFQAEYMSAGAPPSVHVHLLARIGTSDNRRILGQFAADASQPAAENRLASIVDAYAHATDAALAQIVADADAVLTRTSEAR